MIVISSALVLAATPGDQSNNPVVGWHNLVTIDNVTAETEAEGYPATNLANPITAPGARWRADDTTEQAISIAVNTVDPIDYLAIARHNLGSAGLTATVEGSINDGADWTELVGDVLLPDDGPAIFRFEPQALTNIRLVLGTGSGPAEIAVLYTGKLLVIQRRLYVGHTPINMGRSSRVLNGKSESGEFLGRIVLSEQLGTQANFQNLTPAWYRTEMDPFIAEAKSTPFFFAWRPADYPLEVGFAWMTNDPQPSNQRPNGMMQIQLEMMGVAL